MIKAVIFDCFGVLTTDGWKQIREEFFAHDEELMQHALDIDKAVNAGFMRYGEFIGEISKMTGLSSDDVTKRINGNVPNKLLFEYIRDTLKPKYKIGMLSNAAGNWLGELFEPWQEKLFDAIVLSYEIGAVKPESAMYQAAASRLNVLADECLFIDDVELYCDAAERQDMKAIYHEDTRRTIKKFEELLRA